jgi:hypothetical protein
VEVIFLSVVQYNGVSDVRQAVIHTAETLMLERSAF